MSDFLATLAAQALSAAPVAHPLVPARYAPMPPIGGVGTLEGLRAGGGVAASAPEGPPPSLDRVEVPPPLMETGAYHTAYDPFSYLQLRQAGGYQNTLAAEPAPSHDADRPIIIASSAPAGEPAYPVRESTGPPSQIAEPLVATEPPVHQADTTAPPRMPPTPPAAEVVVSAPAAGAPQTDRAGQSTHDATSVHVPSAPRAASATPAAPEQPASVAVEPNATALSTPPAPAAPPAMTEQPALAATDVPPATDRNAPAPDSVVFPRREDAAPAFLAKPSADAEPLAHQPAQAALPRPERAAVQPALGGERSVPAPDPVASPRTRAAVPAFPAKPATDAGLSPYPLGAGARQVPAGSSDPSPAMKMQPATEARASSPQPEVDAPSPVVRAPQTDPGAPFAQADEPVRVAPAQAAAAWPEIVAVSPAQAAAARSEMAVQLDNSDQPRALQTQPVTGAMPSAPRSQVVAPSPEPVSPQPSQATPLTSHPAVVEVVAHPPAARSPLLESVSWPSHAVTALGVEATPPLATTAAVVIQRSFAASDHAVPANAAKSFGSVSAAAGQLPGPVRPSESMAYQPSEMPDLTGPDKSDQTPRSLASSGRVKPSTATPNAPASMLAPQKEPDLARAALDGIETSRSRPPGEQAVVQPVLPADSDTPAGHARAGRSEPNREPAPLPTIRVTIGRIEVRSSAPAHPAAASSPARPRPALSLDDYLKRPAKVRP